jgi:hypothetical protein
MEYVQALGRGNAGSRVLEEEKTLARKTSVQNIGAPGFAYAFVPTVDRQVSVPRGIVADFGITTPKRVARTIVKYSGRHPDLELVSLVSPQVSGTIRRSRPVRGTAESVLKAKKYVIPLAFFNRTSQATSPQPIWSTDNSSQQECDGFQPTVVDASIAVDQLEVRYR